MATMTEYQSFGTHVEQQMLLFSVESNRLSGNPEDTWKEAQLRRKHRLNEVRTFNTKTHVAKVERAGKPFYVAL